MDFLKHRRQTGAGRWFARMVLLAALAANTSGQVGNEYEVKAAFLYKFASFVAWPQSDRSLPVGICVLGHDPFGDSLDRVVKGKSINGREFLVRRLKPGDTTGECPILFIGASERKRLTLILERLRAAPVLTVGDVPGFCQSGGVINFTVLDNRVQLEINPTAAERSGLQLSSRLLSLARIVRESSAGSY